MHRMTFFALIAAGVAFGLPAAPALAQKQELRLAHWVPASHLMTEAERAWIESVEAAAGGNLSIELDRAPLAEASGQYDLVKSGVRDMVWHVPGYTPGRQELLRVAEIPFLCPNATICSPVIWEWYTKHGLAKREFKDTTLLTAWVHGPGLLHTKKEVATVEDLKGLKVRVSGAGAEIAEALGMSAVPMPAAEAHEAILHGGVEGVMLPWVALSSYRLVDLLKYHLEVPGGIYATAFTFIINTKALAKLSAANRAALLGVCGGTAAVFFGKRWDDADTRAREAAVAAGHEIQPLSSAELARWRSRLRFVRDRWIRYANDRGLDGTALLRDLEKRIEAAAAG